MAGGNGKEVVIEVRDLVVGFGDHIVLDHVDLDVYRGENFRFRRRFRRRKIGVDAHRHRSAPQAERYDQGVWR